MVELLEHLIAQATSALRAEVAVVYHSHSWAWSLIRTDARGKVNGLRFKASLRLTSETASAADITARLGIQPTFTRERGEPISPRLPGKSAKHSVWRLESSAAEQEGIEVHLRQLLDVLHGHAAELIELASEYDVDWFCFVDFDGQGSVELSPELMDDLGALPGELVLDLYGSDRDEDQPEVVVDELELSINPRDDLPAQIVESVDAFLQITDGDLLGDRLSVMTELCTTALVEEPVDHALASLEALASAEPLPEGRLARVIGECIVEIEDESEQTRRWHALYDLVSAIDELLTDREKLVGHLLLSHDASPGVLELSENELLALHARMQCPIGSYPED